MNAEIHKVRCRVKQVLGELQRDTLRVRSDDEWRQLLVAADIERGLKLVAQDIVIGKYETEARMFLYALEWALWEQMKRHLLTQLEGSDE